ncbi:hypothetical protein TCAL_00759 [Tigriopus californicus]|uniref:ENTH domain-containing protein n=1 Tax=Tigriopus californicus TaxID=6832 RepID=A0A553P9Z7_TIGCA|nr:clathrin interactor 1-like [Tigriopus californicus]TRY74511.1 hypothetical protein TCAL_00759 [Tigriopus californicus]
MISMWKVREMVDKATNLVMNYTDTEAKVRDATNDDPWGPSGQQMQEVAAFTYTYEQFPEAMGMLWKRMLVDNHTNWRRTYKSLLLLDYLLKNGSERVVTSAREHLYDLRSMENYTFVEENGKDQGVNIRHKVTDLLDFIQDDDRLRDERKKAKKNKDKYIGMSSDAMGFRGTRGFDSGWNDKWNSGGGMSGGMGGGPTSVSRSGFRDHSPEFEDDGYRETTATPPAIDDFKDDDDGFSLPSNSSRGGLGSPTPPLSNTITRPPAIKSPPPFTSKPPAKVSKPRKPIDLGAAATYAQSAGAVKANAVKPGSQTPAPPPKNTQLLDDLFGGETESSNGASNVNGGPQSLPASHVMDNTDLFSASGPSSGITDVNANGDFGDFTSAFTDTGRDDEGFADFSSAFNSNNSSDTVPSSAGSADLFASLPASTANVDLMGGLGSAPAGSTASSNAMDLLGGLDLSGGLASKAPPPPLQMSNNMMGSSSNPPSGFHDLIGSSSGSLGSMPPPLIQAQMGGGTSGVLQPQGSAMTISMGNGNGPPSSSSTCSTMSGKASSSATNSAILPKGWGNVGSLNIDLDNLSLAGRTQTKKSVPMNAMKSSSSSESPVSPLGPQSGFLGGSQNTYLPSNGSNDLL